MSHTPIQNYGPPRDRRTRRRWLTVRNVSYTLIAVAVTLTAISIWVEVTHDDTNRLVEARKATRAVTAARTTPIITEASPVAEVERADPLLIESAVRAQYLGVDDPVAMPADVTVREMNPAPTFEVDRPLGTLDGSPQKPNRSRFVISGGAGGVSISKVEAL